MRFFALPLVLLVMRGCVTAPVEPNSGTAEAVGTILKDIQKSVVTLQSSQVELAKAMVNKAAGQLASDQYIADRVEEARYANNNGSPALVEINLAPAAKVLPPPSAAAKDQEISDLKLALSKREEDKKQMELRVTALNGQADELKGQKKLLDDQLKEKETALVTAAQVVGSKVSDLANASSEIKIKAGEAKTAHEEAAKEAAAKARLSTARWFMIAGGILIAIGVGLTFIHVPDAIAVGGSVGGAFLLIGWLITYVEDLLQRPWFHYVVNGSFLLGASAVVWIGIRAHQHRTTTTAKLTGFENLVGAIEEASKKDPSILKTLQPILKDWHVGDKSVANAINQEAQKLNLTNPGETAIATGSVLPL